MSSAISLAEQIFNTLPDWQAMKVLLKKIAVAFSAEHSVDIFEFVWIGENRSGNVSWETIAANVDSRAHSHAPNPSWQTGLFGLALESANPVFARDLKNLSDGKILEVKEEFSGRSIKRGEYVVGYQATVEELIVPMIVKQNVVGLINIEAFQSGVIERSFADTLSSISKSLARIIDASEYDRDRRKEVERYVEQIDFQADFKRHQDEIAFFARPFDLAFNCVQSELNRICKKSGGKIEIAQPSLERQSIFHDIKFQIEQCMFGVVDITGLNINVTIELGMLIGFGKPALIIQNIERKYEKLPFNIQSIPIYRYQAPDAGDAGKVKFPNVFEREMQKLIQKLGSSKQASVRLPAGRINK